MAAVRDQSNAEYSRVTQALLRDRRPTSGIVAGATVSNNDCRDFFRYVLRAA
jgi:hypothetical protein